jgi:hypothetical protein
VLRAVLWEIQTTVVSVETNASSTLLALVKFAHVPGERFLAQQGKIFSRHDSNSVCGNNNLFYF